MRYKVSALIRADIGAQLNLSIDEPQRNLGHDLKVEFIRGRLLLTRTDQHILVAGSLRSALNAECVRCLESFHLPLQIQLEELFAISPGPRITDQQYVVDWDGIIDLIPALREQFLLAQPIKPVCRPDCKGLCPNCGKNLNEGACDCSDESIDPRLAALKALL
ncbi:MAG TPA: DUF177 domain-containing protein [Anaerolineae bacterium]